MTQYDDYTLYAYATYMLHKTPEVINASKTHGQITPKYRSTCTQ